MYKKATIAAATSMPTRITARTKNTGIATARTTSVKDNNKKVKKDNRHEGKLQPDRPRKRN